MRHGAALRVAAPARVVAVPRHPHQRRQLRGGGAQRAGQLRLKRSMSNIFQRLIKYFTVCCVDLQRAEQSALVTTALVLDMLTLTAGLYTDIAVRGTLSTSESSYCLQCLHTFSIHNSIDTLLG